MRLVTLVGVALGLSLACIGLDAQFSIASLASSPTPSRTYYMATTGSDGNPGTLASPWLSANHALNCGDVILASAGTYSSQETFGTVTCNSTSRVAWLLCATFDGCKITAASGHYGVLVQQSYWGVYGWEVNAAASGANGCFDATPAGAANIREVVFANDICNGAQLGGFGSFPNGSNGVDYFAVIGSVAYAAAQGTTNCYSGISPYEPVQADTATGTHIFIANSFSYANVEPTTCASAPNVGGDGLQMDTFDGSQTLSAPYCQQAYVFDNFFLGNGGRGSEVQNNSAGGCHAPIYQQYNTYWGNSTSTTMGATTLCADLTINTGLNVAYQWNIVQTNRNTACPTSNSLYGIYVFTGGASDTVANNWINTVSGNDTGASSSTGFSFGTNHTGVSPAFAAPAVPGAPSCGSAASVPSCMAPVIANFVASASGATAYGYQPISATNGADPLFPHWVCGLGMLNGLLTLSC